MLTRSVIWSWPEAIPLVEGRGQMTQSGDNNGNSNNDCDHFPDDESIQLPWNEPRNIKNNEVDIDTSDEDDDIFLCRYEKEGSDNDIPQRYYGAKYDTNEKHEHHLDDNDNCFYVHRPVDEEINDQLNDQDEDHDFDKITDYRCCHCRITSTSDSHLGNIWSNILTN